MLVTVEYLQVPKLGELDPPQEFHGHLVKSIEGKSSLDQQLLLQSSFSKLHEPQNPVFGF